jgi:hypothetical protein
MTVVRLSLRLAAPATFVTMCERERALLGAALLDDEFARLLLAEVADDELTDPTCVLVLGALRRGPDADEPSGLELDVMRDVAGGAAWPTWFEPPNGITRVVDALAAAGLLDDAGGLEGVESLAYDRPALWRALRAAREAVDAVGPVEEEPLVALARALLASGE